MMKREMIKFHTAKTTRDGIKICINYLDDCNKLREKLREGSKEHYFYQLRGLMKVPSTRKIVEELQSKKITANQMTSKRTNKSLTLHFKVSAEKITQGD